MASSKNRNSIAVYARLKPVSEYVTTKKGCQVCGILNAILSIRALIKRFM